MGNKQATLKKCNLKPFSLKEIQHFIFSLVGHLKVIGATEWENVNSYFSVISLYFVLTVQMVEEIISKVRIKQTQLITWKQESGLIQFIYLIKIYNATLLILNFLKINLSI